MLALSLDHEQFIMIKTDPDALWKGTDVLHLSVFSFGSTAFSTALGVVVLPVLVLDVVSEELKNTSLGVLGLVGLVVAMVVLPLAGRMSDATFSHWGRRMPYLVAGGLLTCISVFALGAASSYLFLVFSLMVIQISINIALGPYEALIRDLAPQARRGVVSSFKIMADSSGGIVSLLLAALLVGRYIGLGNDVWLWLSLGFISVTLGTSTVWTAIGIRHKDVSAGFIAAASDAGRLKRQTQARFGWFLVSRFCVVAALSMMQTYAVFFLRDVLGLANSVQALAPLTLVTGGALLLVVYPSGRLSDHLGRKSVMVTSAIVGAGGAFGLLMATSFLQVVVMSALLGASAGAFYSVGLAMATDMVSSGHTAQQMGIAKAVAAGGSALAKLAGPGIDLLNRMEEGLGYATLLKVCVVLFLVGAILLIPVQTDIARPLAADSPR